MSIEAELAANTAALNRNSDLLERVVAGQEAAMAKLEGGATTRKPRASKTTETPPADAGDSGNAAEQPAATESPAAAATTAADTASTPTVDVSAIATGIGTDAEKLKAYIGAWTGSTEDAAERAARVELLRAIAASLGTEPRFADLAPHTPKVVFLVERAKALGNAAVDATAAYDYAGDPAQVVAAAESGSDF